MEKIIVSRKWDNAKISCIVETTAIVNDAEIKLTIDLASFLASLTNEIGNPAALMTTAQLHARIVKASAEVIAEMKRASVHVSGAAPLR